MAERAPTIRRESGFTLVEVLVVMLIIGLLAAIAIPAFFNQRQKANDAGAKAGVRTAQTAIETYATTNNGSYVGATAAALRAIEPTIRPNCTGSSPNYTNAPCLLVTGVAARTYTVTVVAKNTRNRFSITRSATALTYPCAKPSATAGNGGCRITSGTTGTWG